MTDRISYKSLRECLTYDPDTGVFTWLHRPLRHFIDVRAQKITNTLFAGRVAGTKKEDHIQIKVLQSRYPAHVLAWFYSYGEWPQLNIDHINNIPTDNRLKNLRIATVQQNSYNSKRRKDNRTGYKGVKKRGNKFTVRISINKCRVWLGTYNTPEEAHAAYCDAAREHFGEFARIS
jgi:hypothetical protein